MKSLRDNIFTGFVIVILVSLAASYDCPEDCLCHTLDLEKPLNHAKCTSLNGLKGEERILSIHSLDLSHANLDRISHSLEKLKDLISLDLSYNNLSDIGRLGKRIKTLKLSNNKITSGKLTKIPSHVQSLDLSFNEITYLPLEITKLKNLKSIELNGNSINCTCETLEVRNWLQTNHVWTDNVRCTYPAKVKGQPWLRVKQSEVCDKDGMTGRHSTHNDNDNENDLMLGDQPIINEGSGDSDVEELGKMFLPVSNDKNKKFERIMMDNQEVGSGDDEIVNEENNANQVLDPNAENEEDDEGSGSGEGPIVIPLSSEPDFNETLLYSETAAEEEEDEEQLTAFNTTDSDDIFGPRLGIMEFDNITTTTEPEEVTEETIVPIVQFHENVAPLDMEPTPIPEEQGEEEEEEVSKSTDDVVDAQNASIKLEENNDAALQEANTGDNSSTYILLAVVLIILVVLIVFVAVKRTRAKRRNRRQTDPESARATELQDMDKTNLGKPIHKNGNAEHAPLIEDRNKTDVAKPVNGNKKVPYVPHEGNDDKAQEPLLRNKEEPDANSQNKIPHSSPESNNNVPPTKTEQPITETPVGRQEAPKPPARHSKDKSDKPETRKGAYPPPKSPRTKKPSMGDDEVFMPSSPKASSRYSPVYSPETGRVKIKLTETPKPKTPLLVTRSRSNAGDIITTPSTNQTMPDNQ